MNTIARHLIAEFYECSAVRLNDQPWLEQSMCQAAKEVGATVVGQAFHQFSPQGVTGTILIEESHLSIHTWPEYQYAAVDIFTCGGLDPRPGFAYLARILGARSYRVQEIVRGLSEHLQESRPLLPNDIHVMSKDVELQKEPDRT